jgi:hypothetical protein
MSGLPISDFGLKRGISQAYSALSYLADDGAALSGLSEQDGG